MGGQVQWSFRVCEMRKQGLLEPVLRAYVVKHVPDDSLPTGVDIQILPLQLDEPSDIGDRIVFLGFPAVGSHVINSDSPLAPPCEDGVQPSLESIRQYLVGLPFVELLTFATGADAVTGNTIEARVSYTLEDFFWDNKFKPC